MKLKRLISAVSAAAILLSAAVPAYAEGKNTKTKEGLELPFELTAPEAVYASLTDQESANTVQLAWSKNDSMSEWAARLADPETHDAVEEEFQQLGFYEIWFTPQMDWSIDGTEQWHWSEETDALWLNEGYDEDYAQRLGDWAYLSFLDYAEKTSDAWVFRWFGYITQPAYPDDKDPLWYGGETYTGWKDALGEGTYKVRTDDDGNQYAVFDWDGHSIYVRMRYFVTYSLMDDPDEIGRQTLASDWTAPVEVQETFEPMTKEELTAPDIKDLKMCEGETFNEYPVFSVMLNVPDALADAITRVASNYENGGQTTIEVQARVKGQEDWVELQGDYWINTGDMKFYMQNLYETQEVPLNMPIEVRARYVTYQGNGYGDVYSDWSSTLEFIKIIPGDVNGDGKVGMKDITDLQRYVNGWNNPIIEEAADLDGDGSIGMKDITDLQRMVNAQ
ncbi:MAG: dockerin type I repeat-containing protein [Ruminococcus sp.]|nr:dockerin type I repeat-containing protein [Ruminococcus sp.]